MAFGFGGQRPPMMPQRPQVGGGGTPGGLWGGNPLTAGPFRTEPVVRSMKKGGKVKKTGIFKLHKGEKVIPAKKKGRKKSDSNAFVAGRRA